MVFFSFFKRNFLGFSLYGLVLIERHCERGGEKEKWVNGSVEDEKWIKYWNIDFLSVIYLVHMYVLSFSFLFRRFSLKKFILFFIFKHKHFYYNTIFMFLICISSLFFYRNVVYNLTLSDLQEQQRLVWYSPEEDVKMCEMKGKDEVIF